MGVLICPHCGSRNIRPVKAIGYWYCDDCNMLLWEIVQEDWQSEVKDDLASGKTRTGDTDPWSV